jgi:glycosyltransferase involved in cell wall biosynthesis
VVESLVSVVIPTTNRAHRIRPTIDSVLAQTHRDLEIVVIDDGSPTDGTAAALARTHERGPRLRVLRHEAHAWIGTLQVERGDDVDPRRGYRRARSGGRSPREVAVR